MSGRGHEDYASVEKAETNLYEVQKRAKLALVIVERSNWKGTPGNFMRQWIWVFCGYGCFSKLIRKYS